jgi:hypothetical protein
MSSLSDVWMVDEPTPQYNSNSQQLSAKNVVEELDPLVPVPESNVRKVEHRDSDKTLIFYLEAVVNEIHELRREQAKRTAIYMILIGILFGSLMLYIDKLHTQIKSINRIENSSQKVSHNNSLDRFRFLEEKFGTM